MKILMLSIAMLFLSSANSPVVENEWMTDYEAAFVKAKKENKYVLLNFTGSDWCGWCRKLDAEVFTQPEFQKYAKEKLVLLKLDYPRRTPQPKEIKIQNQKLVQQFAVRGFPTILLAKANQQVVLRTGYQRGGAASYVQHLDRAFN